MAEDILESPEIYRKIFEIAPQGIVFFDKKGRVINANGRLRDWLGYSPKEIIGKNIVQLPFLSKKSKLIAAKNLAERMLGKNIPAYDLPFISKEGVERIGNVQASIIKNDKGHMIGDVAMVTDVTERRKIEESLRSSEEKFRTLYNSSRDAIMMLVPNRGFISGNPATLRLFGVKDEAAFIKLSPADVSPERQPDGKLSVKKSLQMMKIALEKGDHFFEWVHRTVTGKEFSATVLLAKIELDGKPALQATVRDVSSEKKAADELKKNMDDAERMNKLMVGRELKMVELKRRIAELERMLDKPRK